MEINKTNRIENITVNRKALAALLGFKNDNYINSLVRLHGAPRPKQQNKYDLVSFYRWFIQYKEKQSADEINRLQNQSARDALALANIKLKDLQLADLKTNLIPRNEVNEAWSNEILFLKKQSSKLSGMVSNKLLGISDQKFITDIISNAVDNIFKNIALDKSSANQDKKNNSKMKVKSKKRNRL